MSKGKKIYTLFHKCTAIFLIMTLLWLTVSTPFVAAAQQEIAKSEKMTDSKAPGTDAEEENTNAPGNATEEKVPGSNSLSEEYIHEPYLTHYFFSPVSTYHKCENADTYIAFHGELLVPPPNAA